MARNPNFQSNANFDQLQNQVDEVRDVMTQNIDKILKRGDRLEDLVDKTTELETTAIQFNSQAKKIKRKMWWKNTKMMLILACVVILIIVIISVALALKFGSKSDSTTTHIHSTITSTLKSRIERAIINGLQNN